MANASGLPDVNLPCYVQQQLTVSTTSVSILQKCTVHSQCPMSDRTFDILGILIGLPLLCNVNLSFHWSAYSARSERVHILSKFVVPYHLHIERNVLHRGDGPKSDPRQRLEDPIPDSLQLSEWNTMDRCPRSRYPSCATRGLPKRLRRSGGMDQMDSDRCRS